MDFYLVLIIATFLILYLSWMIWKKTKEISFLIGIGFIYYWTLLGSWFFVFDEFNCQKGKLIGLHYYYLFDKMFPVHLDQYYFKSLLYYSFFIISIQTVTLFFLKKHESIDLIKLRTIKPIVIKLKYLILVTIISISFSFVLVKSDILIAINSGQSIYLVTRTYPNPYFTLHQLLNLVSFTPLLAGFFLMISKKHNLFLDVESNKLTRIVYVIILIITEGYLILLGNKHDLFFGIIFCFLLYLYNINFKIYIKDLFVFAILVGLPLVMTDSLRGISLEIIFSMFGLNFMEIPKLANHNASLGITTSGVLTSLLFSNEMFCAHFSMYGALSFNIPFTYGSSILSLITSIIPKIFYSNRPEPIYDYYASLVHADPGQGYTINHATAWYLNFGIFGIFIGGALIGIIWSWLYNLQKSNYYNKSNKKIWQLFYILAFIGFTAHIPNIIRSGPEVYKSVIFESLLLPLIVFFIASKKSEIVSPAIIQENSADKLSFIENQVFKNRKILIVIPASEIGSSMIFSKRQIHDLEISGFQITTFFLASRTSIKIIFNEFFRLKNIINDIKPVVLHSHYGSVTAFLCSAFNRIPFVITFHGSDLNRTPSDGYVRDILGRTLSQIAAIRATKIICVSNNLKNKLWFNKHKALVIPMGVDTELFNQKNKIASRRLLNLDANKFYILFNSNNPHIKREDLALTSLLKLKEKNSKFEMIFLKGEINPNSIPDFLNAVDCVLLCSNSEGSPMIIKEALACNTPIVATDIGDVKERIDGLSSCIIVEQNPNAIAEGIYSISLLNYKMDGRQRIFDDELSSLQVAHRLKKLYLNILTNKYNYYD